MDWRNPLHTEAARLGRPFHEHPLGVGIDFRDGCDAFWVLPGELTSTIPLPPDVDPDPQALLAAYHELDALRDRALHVIRHHLASKKFRVDRRRSGEWPIELAGSTSTSISVGAYLTTVARDTRDVHAVVRACFEYLWIGKSLSPQQINRHLNTPGDPADERPISDERRRPDAPGLSTIRVALNWMGLCSALDHPENFESPGAIKAAITPTGRIGQALLRLADRLPATNASADLSTPGALHLSFDDGLGDFTIDARHDRALAHGIAADGPASAGDHLADQFLALNAARTQTLRAVRQAAAARGWRQERFHMGLLGGQRTIYLGATHRDVTFHPDQPLTGALRDSSPETAVRALFSAHPDFADACVAALKHPLPDDQIVLPDADLLPRDIPPAPPLRPLDRDVIAELERFADAALADYWAGKRTIWDYRDADVYHAATDTWATPVDWVRVAERHLGSDWPHPMAALILLDAGDPRGDALARRYVDVAEEHDVSDIDVELVWRYRHVAADKAREWFAPSPADDVPYAAERAKVGDPVALRQITADAEAVGASGADPLANPDALGHLSPDRLDQVHRDLVTWARTDHHWSPPREEKLRAALHMGWRDVASAFPSNPYFLSGLLVHARRSGQFDEPGILLAKDFLLLWSRLAPGPFLARFIATAVGTDLVAQADEASRRSAIGKPDVQRNLGLAAGIYRAWWADLQPTLAIAWKRCRPAVAP